MANVSNAEVVLLGVGVVFFGLICIVVLCKIAGAIMQNMDSAALAAAAAPAPAPARAQAPAGGEDRDELLAAISAAAAEMLGTDMSGIRILSFKEL